MSVMSTSMPRTAPAKAVLADGIGLSAYPEDNLRETGSEGVAVK
jgi:hypothetical protein